MTQKTDEERAEIDAEILEAETRENRLYGFHADIKTHIENPNGKDAIVEHRYQARPEFDVDDEDSLADKEGTIYAEHSYWRKHDYDDEDGGEREFPDALDEWQASEDIDINDDDALLEAVKEDATSDLKDDIEEMEFCYEIFTGHQTNRIQ